MEIIAVRVRHTAHNMYGVPHGTHGTFVVQHTIDRSDLALCMHVCPGLRNVGNAGGVDEVG